jgi:inhibitor of cysteine peptidase
MTTKTLTEADDAVVLDVHPDDHVVVELAENATTGYRWQLERLEGPATLEEDGYAPMTEPLGATSEDVVIGRGGIRQFRFRVVGPGTVELALRHWQEWSGEDSVTARFRATLRSLSP